MPENKPIEAVMVAFSKVKEGTKLVLVLHPSDVPDWLQLAPLGQRIACAMVPMKDETSEHGQGEPVTKPPGLSPDPSSEASAKEGAWAKGGKPWADHTATWQAAMRCKDVEFQIWVLGTQRYAAYPGQVADETIEWVRRECGVTSRSELLPGTDAEAKWRAIDARFIEESGRMAERR